MSTTIALGVYGDTFSLLLIIAFFTFTPANIKPNPHSCLSFYPFCLYASLLYLLLLIILILFLFLAIDWYYGVYSYYIPR